jgi:hypothetical protein
LATLERVIYRARRDGDPRAVLDPVPPKVRMTPRYDERDPITGRLVPRERS